MDPSRRPPSSLHAKLLEKAMFKLETKHRLSVWRENFPFRPVHHATLRYNPDAYDQSDPLKSFPNGGEEWETYEMILHTHGALKEFHENELRFSDEFEKLYRILEQHDRAKDPMVVSGIFANLAQYHAAKLEDPAALWHQMRYDSIQKGAPLVKVPIDGKTTWGEHVESLRGSIIYLLLSRRENPGMRIMNEDEAVAVADRIIDEIPGHNLARLTSHDYFALQDDPTLEAGDPLLIPYEGYLEDYLAWAREDRRASERQQELERSADLRLNDDGRIVDAKTGQVVYPNAAVFIKAPGERAFQPVAPHEDGASNDEVAPPPNPDEF